MGATGQPGQPAAAFTYRQGNERLGGVMILDYTKLDSICVLIQVGRCSMISSLLLKEITLKSTGTK